MAIKEVLPPLIDMLMSYGMPKSDADKTTVIKVDFEGDGDVAYILLVQKKGVATVCQLHPKEGVCLFGTIDMFTKKDMANKDKDDEK